MKKITEDHCSLEICKLLKNRGFSEKTDYVFYYYEEDGGWCFEKLLDGEWFNENKMLRCPTHQMVLKWLRENYNIGIFPSKYNLPEGKFYGVAIVDLENLDLMDNDYFYSETYDGSIDHSISFVLQRFIKD